MAKLEINNLTKLKVDRRPLQKIFSNFIKTRNRFKKAEVSLVFVNKKVIQQLNWEYRHRAEPTDVLSFSELEADLPMLIKDDFLGEIVICYQVAVEQAKARKEPFISELRILFAHGLAHLIGYDHQNRKEAKAMQRFEKKMLNI